MLYELLWRWIHQRSTRSQLLFPNMRWFLNPTFHNFFSFFSPLFSYVTFRSRRKLRKRERKENFDYWFFFFSGVSGKLNEMSYFYGSIEWEESFKVLSYIFFFSIVFRGIERGYFGISPDSVYQFSWGFVSVSSFFSLWFSLNIWCDSMN